ncbi:glutathione S-transferase family protein [Fodinicurvata sp. EGI_FJ10296]|uniref:glutathione S-transferase family protein n=1 Tax=Fodinicurvata sp. EGI_FJ10296 TaxID=3231908 RepID=UPI00345683A1
MSPSMPTSLPRADYKLFIANKNYSSWSLRPWVLMRTLGITFAEHLTPFTGATNRETFQSFSPNAMVPCLHDGDLRLWESLAIIEYLAERHEGVWPSDPTARAWARCASAEMHAGFAALRDQCTMTCGQRVRLHEVMPALSRDLERLDSLWREGMETFGGPFLAGNAFTAVDAMFAPVAFRVQSYGDTPGFSLSPTVTAYVDRLLALDAMREWYDAALAEPWREPAHEADVARVGSVTGDLRTPV